jgi:membrane-associated protease RseP (regulator of RpoE activity)
MEPGRREGVSLGLAAALVLIALFVGLLSGLALGAAGGFVLGRSQAEGVVINQRRAQVLPLVPPAVGTPGASAVGAPYLGVEVRSAAPSAANGTPQAAAGAMVLTVEPNTGAAAAGLEPGDLIVEFAGQAIENGADLAAAVSRTTVGQEVPVKVVRGSATLDLTVTIGTRRSGVGVLPGPSGPPDLEDFLQQLPDDLRQRFRELLEPVTPQPQT